MGFEARQTDLLFLLTCFGLGILAELSFFHGSIGLSYIIFITAFYLIIFLRFRFSFNHRRIGLFLMVGIWTMATSFLFYDSTVFNVLNSILIPATVFFQIVLITSPSNLNWSKLSFIRLVTGKLLDALAYFFDYLSIVNRKLFRKGKVAGIYRQVLYGVLFAVPILFIIIRLLISADQRFRQLLSSLAFFQFKFDLVEIVIRIGIVLIATLFFFCILQVLGKSTKREYEIKGTPQKTIHGIMASTVLVLLNVVYFLFLVIQFSYFFHDGLQEGFTYAEYARRGFFELLAVTLINWIIILLFMKRVKVDARGLKLTLKTLLSVLIVESGVILLSAYQRLSLYEAVYGYTVDRLLAHAFMVFLIVIFAYTLIRVWLENLSLLHFYLITAFLFYTVLNAVNIEEMVVNNNLKRYEETDKMDIYYLYHLGSEGVKGLIVLYENEPKFPELKELLQAKKEQIQELTNSSWQEFNFAREEVKEKLEELEL